MRLDQTVRIEGIFHHVCIKLHRDGLLIFGWQMSLAVSVSSGLGGDEGGAGLQRLVQHSNTGWLSCKFYDLQYVGNKDKYVM